MRWWRKLHRGSALLGFLLGLLIAGAVAIWLCGSDDPPQSTPDEGRAYSPVPDQEAGELAERFRPWLRFDSDERWRPVSLESLFAERSADGEPAQRFCLRSQQGSSCQPIDDMATFDRFLAENSTLASSTYVDIAGNQLGEYRAPESDACSDRDLSDCGEGPGSAIYYRVTSSNERFYIDYWWFMRFNHFAGTSGTCFIPTEACAEHEGDWEGVTLVTPPEDSSQLDYVVYAAHKGTFRYPAEPLPRHDGWRPEVFVASGSHASYPKACPHRICRQPITKGGIPLPETSTDGLREWARNEEDCAPGAPGSCLLPLPEAEPGGSTWTTWPGLWGASCGERCDSRRPQAPASPGLQARFLAPWCSTQADAITCDAVGQGCSDWLGPLVSALACNPSAVVRGLSTPEELPSGGLKLIVVSPGDKPRRVSATTRGVVQVLGAPLKPGDRLSVVDAGPSTAILVRAKLGAQLLEARFDPFRDGSSGGAFEVRISARNGIPVAVGTRGAESEVPPAEKRRIRLAPPQ